ncbi:MAG: hypothetical protein AB1568_04835 [Thermodesulfobacteriota bacterium]
MAISDKNTTITVAIDKDTKALLEKYAVEMDLTRSKLARNLIYIALDDFKILKFMGVIRAAKVFRDIMEVLHEKLLGKFGTEDMEEIDNDTMSVIIDTEIKELLDRYSAQVGLPLRIFCRNLVYIGLDEFKLLRKVGAVRLAGAFRQFMESFEAFEIEDFRRRSQPH